VRGLAYAATGKLTDADRELTRLLAAGPPAEAESIYWQDLSRNRENGWSLFGLMQSLRAQGNTEEAAVIEARFRKAWSGAAVTLTASRFMGGADTIVAAKSVD